MLTQREAAPQARPPAVSSGGALAAGVVDGIGLLQNQLRDGHKGIALLEQALQNTGEGLRGVEGGVVKEDNGAALHPGGHPLRNLLGGDLFPVQAVTVPNRFKINSQCNYKLCAARPWSRCKHSNKDFGGALGYLLTNLGECAIHSYNISARRAGMRFIVAFSHQQSIRRSFRHDQKRTPGSP